MLLCSLLPLPAGQHPLQCRAVATLRHEDWGNCLLVRYTTSENGIGVIRHELTCSELKLVLLHLPKSKRQLGVDWSSGRLYTGLTRLQRRRGFDWFSPDPGPPCRLCPGQLSLIYKPRIWRGWLRRHLDAMHASESLVDLTDIADNGWSAHTLLM